MTKAIINKGREARANYKDRSAPTSTTIYNNNTLSETIIAVNDATGRVWAAGRLCYPIYNERDSIQPIQIKSASVSFTTWIGVHLALNPFK